MRETYGGRDATSKWFESTSWILFAAINDPDTAEYISKRCSETTVEVDQTNRSSGMKGSSRSRSKQLSSRRLILPHEVMRMRTDGPRPREGPRLPQPAVPTNTPSASFRLCVGAIRAHCVVDGDTFWFRSETIQGFWVRAFYP